MRESGRYDIRVTGEMFPLPGEGAQMKRVEETYSSVTRKEAEILSMRRGLFNEEYHTIRRSK